jgi:hypothetical protein
MVIPKLKVGPFLASGASLAIACGGAGGLSGVIVGCWVARLNGIPVASAQGLLLAVTIGITYCTIFLAIGLIAWALGRAAVAALGRPTISRLRIGLAVGVSSCPLILLVRSHLAYGRPRSSLSLVIALMGSALLTSLAIVAPRTLRRVVTYGSVIPAVVLFTAISTEPKGEAKPGPAVRLLDQKLSLHSDPGAPNRRRRILLVGFDGLDPVTLQTLMARGEMPTFSGLRHDGTFARSKTLSPTASPIIWSTIATGKQPEKHGIFGFVNHTFPGLERPIARYPEGVGYQRMTSLYTSLGLSRPIPPSRDQLTTNAIWDVVSATGGRVAVVNWWVSWPAESVHGVIVSDRFFSLLRRRASAQEAQGATYPPALYDRLVGSIDTGRSQLLADLDDAEQEKLFGGLKGRSDRELLEWALALDDTSMGVAGEVLKRGPYDFVAVYLRGIDIVSHGFSNQGSAQARDLYRRKLLEGYYHQADRQLATLMSLADHETDVLVCSDHGFEMQPEGTYGHRDAPDGVFLLGGPDVEHGKEIARVRVADYTPTMLYLLGKPVGKDMDGRVLAEALRPELLAHRPVDYLPSYDDMPRQARLQDSSIDDETYQDLRALGYVK